MMCGFILGKRSLTILALTMFIGAVHAAGSDATGAEIYQHYCIVCHDRGSGHPGTQNLAYRYGPEKAALADRDNLTPEYVRIMVRFGRGLMPGFRPSEISDDQVKLLAGYLASGPHPAAGSDK